MGIYLNPGNKLYHDLLNSRVVVDKSLLIEKMIGRMNSSDKYNCVSRPRRFGKSTDANMLAAYFSKGCDSREMFAGLKISGCADYEAHLNKHNVVQLNIQNLYSQVHDISKMINLIYLYLAEDANDDYQITSGVGTIVSLLSKIHAKTGQGFIFIIDEWDCIFREFKDDEEKQREYLDFLRMLLKDQSYVDLVYMTGILPIKKYGTHSALNMFNEISMIDAKEFSEFMGFTEDEVKELCEKHDRDFLQMKEWYDGYRMRGGISTYAPRSVSASISNRDFASYWSQTETYEALKVYIELDYDGLRNDVLRMLAGERVSINAMSFQNDMSTFKVKDDVMTLLVHLGYLGYAPDSAEVYIPNQEVRETFVTSIQTSDWDIVTKVFRDSRELLNATWTMQAERVAAYIQNSHYETSIIQYNDENALSYTVSLAYVTARQFYNIYRELPTGKGYADIVFVPRIGVDKPAMVVELTWDRNADAGIRQIKDRKYFFGLDGYLDDLLLVAVNYDKDTKEHECVIERYS